MPSSDFVNLTLETTAPLVTSYLTPLHCPIKSHLISPADVWRAPCPHICILYWMQKRTGTSEFHLPSLFFHYSSHTVPLLLCNHPSEVPGDWGAPFEAGSTSLHIKQLENLSLKAANNLSGDNEETRRVTNLFSMWEAAAARSLCAEIHSWFSLATGQTGCLLLLQGSPLLACLLLSAMHTHMHTQALQLEQADAAPLWMDTQTGFCYWMMQLFFFFPREVEKREEKGVWGVQSSFYSRPLSVCDSFPSALPLLCLLITFNNHQINSQTYSSVSRRCLFGQRGSGCSTL